MDSSTGNALRVASRVVVLADARPDEAGAQLLNQAIGTLRLSARGYHRVAKRFS